MHQDVSYRVAVGQIADFAIFLIGLDGCVASWNAGVRQVLGWDEGEWLGQPLAVLFPPEDVARGEPEAELARARESGRAGDDRWQIKKDATRFWASGVTTAVRDEGGVVTGFVKVIRDLTAEKHAEERRAVHLAVTSVLADAPDLADALPTLLRSICNASRWQWGALWEVDPTAGVLRLVACWSDPSHPVPAFEQVSRGTTFAHGDGMPGRTWASSKPHLVEDTFEDPNFPRRTAAAAAGFKAALGFPVAWGGTVHGVMEFFSTDVRPPDASLLGTVAIVAGQIGQFIDRKVTAERLRATETRHAASIDAALDCIVSMDHRGTVTEWNPAAEQTFGVPRDEALHRELAELIIPPRLRRAHREGLARYLATGEGKLLSKRLELSAVRRDGTELPVELTITRLPSSGPPEFTGFIRDLSEQKAAEHARRWSELRWQRLVEQSPLSTQIFAPDGSVRQVNRAWERLWGFTLDEVPGYDIRHDPQLAELGVMPIVERAFAGEAVTIPPIPYRTDRGEHAGEVRIVGAYVYPIKDDAGRVEEVVLVHDDVTERVRAQEERERLLASERAARSEAEHASRMKDEFLATLSHELRTPLNAILGWAQVLSRGTRSAEEVSDGLRTIERNARAQSQIIEDLLDMSRIISGKVRLDVQRVDLPALVQAAVQTIAPSAEAKGIRVQSVLDPRAGPVSGDPARLQQIFWNLLSNAVKFTPKGGRVQVVLERVSSRVEIAIADTGQGIDPEFLPFVFDRFRQADASATRRHGGLGLGLSIVKQLVELHGGTVQARSLGVGHGTTMTVSLPWTVIHPEAAGEGSERHHPSTPRGRVELPDDCRDMSGVKVLVVDDERDARALVQRLLEDCSATVSTAGSVEEALAAVERDTPDVLVCDIGMPGEDGYTLIKRVRALPGPMARVPAVALTAYARPEDRVKAVLAGFQIHVAKPVEPAELIAVVASLARR